MRGPGAADASEWLSGHCLRGLPAFFEDPRLELVAGRVAAGREGAIFHITNKWVGSGPEVVVADSMTREDILAIAPRLGPDREFVIVTGRAGTGSGARKTTA